MTQNKELIFQFGNESYKIDDFILLNMFEELNVDVKINDFKELDHLLSLIQETIFRYEFISLLDGEEIVKMLRLLIWVKNIFKEGTSKIEIE